MTTDTEKAVAYAVGICTASVCFPQGMSKAEVERQINAAYPTGISSRWQFSTSKAFATGQPNPGPCNDKPETHVHRLMEC